MIQHHRSQRAHLGSVDSLTKIDLTKGLTLLKQTVMQKVENCSPLGFKLLCDLINFYQILTQSAQMLLRYKKNDSWLLYMCILITFFKNNFNNFKYQHFAGTELTFQHPPQSVSVNAGQTVSIIANVRNANHVYWCKGRDHVIRISTSFEECYNNSNKAVLTLKNARLQDDGEYTCVAEKYGKNRKEIRESFFIYVHHGNYFSFSHLSDSISYVVFVVTL